MILCPTNEINPLHTSPSASSDITSIAVLLVHLRSPRFFDAYVNLNLLRNNWFRIYHTFLLNAMSKPQQIKIGKGGISLINNAYITSIEEF